MGFKLENINHKKAKHKISRKSSLLNKEIHLFGRTFSNKVKENFYTELGVLLKAGINLKAALELIQKAQNKKQNAILLTSILEAIVAGKSLSEAMLESKAFTEYEYYSIKIGEETGTLDLVSTQLSHFFGRKNEQKRQLIAALTYPIIILITAVLVVVFMLQFVVPMFQDIFRQQQIELPTITKIIIRLSDIMKSYGWIVLLGIFGVFGLNMLFFENPKYKKLKDNFILKIPFVGNFIKTVYLSQFTQAISLLTVSKISIINSIQLTSQMIRFYPLKTALKQVEEDILRGNSLSYSMAQHKIFDHKMIAMIKVAEETNQNAYIFERLNLQYRTQVEQQSKVLSTIMEPFIILFVGGLVGIVLIAMYLPMFKLSSMIG